jgi:hypothetical protein
MELIQTKGRGILEMQGLERQTPAGHEHTQTHTQRSVLCSARLAAQAVN